MIENQGIVSEAGWFDAGKEKVGTLFGKLRESKDTFFDIALYGGFGFLVGYLVKKFSSYLIMLAIFIVVIFALQQFEILFVAVNWAKIQTFLGMQPVATPDATLFGMYWDWVKENVLISVSFIIGFLLGLKFGA